MTPATRPLLGLVVLAGLFCWLVVGIESCHRTTETKHEQKDHEAKGRADAHEGEAGQADARAAAREGDLAQSKADTERLRLELERLRRRPVAVRPIEPGTSALAEPVADLAPLVAKQDELIQALEKDNGLLRAQLIDVTAGRDKWRLTAKAREDQVFSLELALEAQKAMTRGALWRGRLQGFAVGFAAHDIAGRIR